MKTKFKKAVLPVCALAAALVLVVSCSTGEGAGYEPWNGEESPADLDVTISWWNNYEAPDPITEESRLDDDYAEYWWATDVIEAFNELYPNITVDMEYIGSYSTIQSQVNSGLSGGNVPNIATCYGDHVAGYNNAGATLVMDDFLTDEYIGYGKGVDSDGNIIDDESTAQSDVNAQYLVGEKEMYTSDEYEDGAYLSLPYSKSAETLAVNLDVFNKVGSGYVDDVDPSNDQTTGETDSDGNTIYVSASGTEYTIDESTRDTEDGYVKVTTVDGYEVPYCVNENKTEYAIPTNWKELISLARQMKEDFPHTFETQKDSDNLYIAVPFVYDSGENMMISFMEMCGIPYTDGSGETAAERVLFNNDEAKEMVYQIKEWYDEGLISIQDTLYWSNRASGYHQYSSTMVCEGTVFMAVSSTAGTRYYESDDFDAEFFETPTFNESCYDSSDEYVDSQHRVISQGPSLTFFDKEDIDENYASWLFYKFLTNSENSATLAVNTSYFPIRESSYESEEVSTLVNAASTARESGVDTVMDNAEAALGSDATEEEISTARSEARGNAYTGEVLDLNETYTEGEDYIFSDVFDESSDTRTAVGDLLEAVLNYSESTSAEDIENKIDEEFSAAYASAVGAN